MSIMMMKQIWFLGLMLLACGVDHDDAPKPVTPGDDGPKQYGVPFARVPAVEDIVLYEVNTRAYSAAGNFQGVIDRLDQIRALGVNTIWLMPVHPVGQVRSAGGLGSPYSVQDYSKVNPEFGDMAKLRELVDKAHERNIAVILDWVANHTSWDNPWMQNKSWYTQDAQGNIIVPPGTNWQDVAELNYSNTDMRKAMIDAMKYWLLEANVDGFRCDAVDFVPTDFWKQAIDALKAVPNRKLILLAEGGKPENFTAGFQMNYAWDFYTNLKQVYGEGKAATSVIATHQAEYKAIPEGAKKLRYTTNHDVSAYEGTPVELFGGVSGALSASVVTIFTSAVPLVYSSQEVGQLEKLPFFTREPINWSANPDMENAYEKLFKVYNSTPAFTDGTLQDFSSVDVVAFTREAGQERYLVIVNVRNGSRTFTLADTLKNTTWTDGLSGSAVSLGTTVSLGAYEYKVLKR